MIFLDDGFRIMEGTKKRSNIWIYECIFHKKEINSYTCIPQKSGHVVYAIKNYVLDELRRYIRYNLLNFSFLKIRTHFFSRLRNRGSKKVWLQKQFATLKYEDHAKLMENAHDSPLSLSLCMSHSTTDRGGKLSYGG